MVEIQPTKMLITWGWWRFQPGSTTPPERAGWGAANRASTLEDFAGRWHPEMEGISIWCCVFGLMYIIYIYMKLHEYFQILTVFGYSLGWLSSCPMVMCHIVLLIYLVHLGSRVIPIMSNYETPPYGLLFYQGGHHLVDLCGFWQAKFRHPTWAPHSAFFP